MPEHILAADCWCHPHVLAYGEEPVYDEHGEMIGVTTPEPDEEEDE